MSRLLALLERPKFRTIYADPPWLERGGGKIQRGADRHYPLMHTRDIAALPVGELAHEDGCHLYLWVTNNFLQGGFKVLEAWGFQFVTMITWPKPRMGIGQYYRGQTEHLIFARTRAVLPYRQTAEGKRGQGTTLLDVWAHPERKHSAKPPQARQWIERVSHGPRIELFSREAHDGWTVLGNETSGGDIAADIRGIL